MLKCRKCGFVCALVGVGRVRCMAPRCTYEGTLRRAQVVGLVADVCGRTPRPAPTRRRAGH